VLSNKKSLDWVKSDEKDGRTTLTSEMLFESKEIRDACLKSGMELGVREAYENIDKLLVTMAAEKAATS
jgi:hypothetical protein